MRREEEESPGISYEALFALIAERRPFAELSRGAFEGVLDMLAGGIRRMSLRSCGRGLRGTGCGTGLRRAKGRSGLRS